MQLLPRLDRFDRVNLCVSMFGARFPAYDICLYVWLIFLLFLTVGADDGIEEIQGDGVVLRCLQTRTGMKFVVT